MVDTSPEALSQAFSGLMTGSVGAVIVKTFVWIGIILAIGSVFFIAYLMMVYKYNITIFNVVGSGTSRTKYSIGKKKWDKAKENKDGSWTLLLSRKNIEPLTSEHIYHGNKVYMYNIDGKLAPGKINVDEEVMSINPVPYSMRKKTELELQQLEQDFAKMDAWQANKLFVYSLIAVGMVIILVGFVIYLSFEKVDTMVPTLNSIASGLGNMNNIPGQG